MKALPSAIIVTALAVGFILSGCAGHNAKPEPPGEKPDAQALPAAYVSEAMLQQILERYGYVVSHRVRLWQQMIDSAKDYSIEENLERVNDFFNGALFDDDLKIWGKEDYWATPLEFLIMDAGDCEDFAMAKYFTLLQMGIDSRDVRLTYCKALTLNKAHMVVSFYPSRGDSPLILDNLNQRIRPAEQRPDLLPVYSFNGESLWLARKRREDFQVNSVEQLRLWQEWQIRTASREVPLGLVLVERP